MNIQALIEKAEIVFKATRSREILTGQGLSRKELRRLEKYGIVEKTLGRIQKTGQIIYKWKLLSSASLITRGGKAVDFAKSL